MSPETGTLKRQVIAASATVAVVAMLVAAFADHLLSSSVSFASSVSKIAFTSDRDGHGEVSTINVDGSNPVNLTNNPPAEINPSRSLGDYPQPISLQAPCKRFIVTMVPSQIISVGEDHQIPF